MKISFKSIALTAILLTAMQGGAFAQAFWGFYAGTNSAGFQMKGYVNPKDPFDLQPKLEKINRITAGVTCELPLSKYFFLQPELSFVQRGGIVSWDTGFSDISGSGTTMYQTVNNIDLGYIQLPVLLKVRWQLTHPTPIYPHENSGKPWYLEFYAGPAFNYALLKKSNYSQTIHHVPIAGSDTSYKIKGTGTPKGLKSMDLSAVMGLNIKWRFSRRAYLWAGARYSMNFFDINDTYIRLETLDKEGKDKIVYPTLKNTGNLSFQVGISTTFTKRRYWDHPRDKNRKF